MSALRNMLPRVRDAFRKRNIPANSRQSIPHDLHVARVWQVAGDNAGWCLEICGKGMSFF
ncbi:MAG: hypothetical protein O2945_03845 [Planctomycetota bacterium]|nr:hypothetical protein [Planctomycetota bacterium]